MCMPLILAIVRLYIAEYIPIIIPIIGFLTRRGAVVSFFAWDGAVVGVLEGSFVGLIESLLINMVLAVGALG
jgi:hypothetical protein